MQTNTELYPLKDNQALVDLCRCHRASGMTFQHFRDVHAIGACKQLSPDDLKRLEELSRPAST